VSADDDYDTEVEAFFRKNSGRVLGYLINMGTDRGLAEEITIDAFMAARIRWTRVRSHPHPESYVFVIARNERGKRQARHSSFAGNLCSDLPDVADPAGADSFERALDRTDLRVALGLLPERERETITLRYLAALSVEETAKIMGVHNGTVKRYTSDGLRKLRSLVRKSGEDIDDKGALDERSR
jgi:RNA polymerase sigma factor (sigma-70 family)